MELFDTHAHLTFEQLAGDVEAVLRRSRDAGVTGWITVGTDAEHNRKVVRLIEKFDNLYGTVGIHPHYAKDVTNDDIAELKQLTKNEKIVAIGETGLDFHYNFSKQQAQVELFRRQLQIAAELNMPIIVHSREAFEQTMSILDEFAGKIKNVVLHCFSGTAEETEIAVNKGYYISFTGVVTFKNAAKARQAAKLVPLDRLMLETDCPYMSPEPVRGQKINEPALMIHTAAKLAEIKEVNLEDFTEAVKKNTQKFFGVFSA